MQFYRNEKETVQIAPHNSRRILVFWRQISWWNPDGVIATLSTEAPNTRRGGKACDFRQIHCYISKTVQDRRV